MKIYMLVLTLLFSSFISFAATSSILSNNKPRIINPADSYQVLKNHPVFKVVEGRWQGQELNIYAESGEQKYIPRDFRIGPSKDGTQLVFESLVPNDNYIGYFSYYDEDCLQYDEYGFVQHLCLGPSGYVSWSGPCSAGSYRTKMTHEIQNGRDVIVKAGDHWNHEGKLHRRNSGVFIRISE